MSSATLPVLRDFTQHPYEQIAPTQVQDMYNFTAPLLGEGCLSFLNPKEGISVFYLKCLPTESFIIEAGPMDTETIFFNYLVKASKNVVSKVAHYEAFERLSDHVLLIDNTSTEQKSMELSGNEKLEMVQIAFSRKVFMEYFDRFLGGYPDEIKETCWRSCYTTEHYGVLIPFDARQENCLMDMLYSTFDGPLRNLHAELKVSELLLYYFQYIISGELAVHGKNGEFISEQDKEKVFALKEFLDQYHHEISVEELSDKYGFKPAFVKKIFRQVFGVTIAKYHKRQRLNQAYLYILNNTEKWSIKEIAFEVGFNSVQSFSRSFYNEFKIRPTDVRLKFSSQLKSA